MVLLVLVAWAGWLAMTLGGVSACSSPGSPRDAGGAGRISSADALADFDRVWEIVHETHFDPTFNGVDWQAVRAELRPRAQVASTRAELRMIEQEMLDRLGQSHFAIIPGSVAEPIGKPVGEPAGEAVSGAGGKGDEESMRAPSSREGDRGGERTGTGTGEGSDARGLAPAGNGDDAQGEADTGIELRIVDGRAVVWRVRRDSPAQRAGVRTGWVLTGIRERDVDAMLGDLRVALGEEELGIHAVGLLGSELRGREGTGIALTFLDGRDTVVEKEIEREAMPGQFVKFGNLPPLSTHLDWSRERHTSESGRSSDIGVIRFNIWMIPIAPKFERAMYELRDCDGIIIDLRGNPGGVGALSSSLGRFLMSKKGSLGTMTMRGAELSFNIEPVVVTTWGERLAPFTGPVAILQDSGSASTSEVFAGGMQSLGRVRVFGTRSAGMALPAGMDKLPSGDVLLHAIADFVTSTGARMEDGGVVPDERVELTRADLLAGVDAPQRAAMEWIANTSR